jgi:CubicO group peptidase (beta-lactamase class C family)
MVPRPQPTRDGKRRIIIPYRGARARRAAAVSNPHTSRIMVRDRLLPTAAPSAALVVTLLMGLATPAVAQVPTSARAPEATRAPEAARVDSLFGAWLQPGSPGAAVAVLRDGEIVLERGYGSAQLEHGVPITPATIFHVASVTKQFTTFAVALLASRGALSLDDDVRDHIPELPDLGHRITLRHLIHHTSGIRDQWELLAMAGWRLDDVITKAHVLGLAVRQRELNFTPGSEHLYSNMGYTLLAEVVERVGGAPFPEWMEGNVFLRLGMTSTHMHDDHQRVVPGRAYSYRGSMEQGWQNAVLSYANAGATSLFTTAGDLARWLRNFETAELGGAAVIEQMRERGVLTSGDTLAYAFAIVRGEQRGRPTWSHGGADAGFRSTVLHMPGEGLGVVVLSNHAAANPARLAAEVADVFLGPADPTAMPPVSSAPPTPERRTPVIVPTRLLEAYAGQWEVDRLGVLRLRRDGGSLVVDLDGRRLPLIAESDSTFLVENARVRFLPAPEGVDRLVVQVGDTELPGRRVAPPALDPVALAAYTGDYFSPELETVYRVVTVDGGLVARHVRHGDIALTPVDPDHFAGSQWFFGRVAFDRDEGGVITGFRATGNRVRDLRFVRLADGALP